MNRDKCKCLMQFRTQRTKDLAAEAFYLRMSGADWNKRREILAKLYARIQEAKDEPAERQIYLLGLEAGQLLQLPRTDQVKLELQRNFTAARRLGVEIDLTL